jgi:hypothetical protein
LIESQTTRHRGIVALCERRSASGGADNAACVAGERYISTLARRHAARWASATSVNVGL